MCACSLFESNHVAIHYMESNEEARWIARAHRHIPESWESQL